MFCRFMSRIDSRKELAPRDVVARAIHAQMAERGDPHVLLDVSHAPAAEVLAHFPNIAAHCATAGVDITREPIPVAPAQHYMCGGVQVGPEVYKDHPSIVRMQLLPLRVCLSDVTNWHVSAPRTAAQIPGLFMRRGLPIVTEQRTLPMLA